jgi:hypothetical protein
MEELEQVAAAREDGDRVAHLTARVEGIEATATSQSAELDSKFRAAHKAATDMQRQVVEKLTERATKHEADVRALQGFDSRLRETDSRVRELVDRSKKLAEAIDADVARLSAALERVSMSAFGRELVAGQDVGEPSLMCQIGGLTEALRGKSDAAVMEHVKHSNTQVCWHAGNLSFHSCGPTATYIPYGMAFILASARTSLSN